MHLESFGIYVLVKWNYRKMNLRDLLMRDFNINLNITGGFGQSVEDPIVLLDSNPFEASMTQMQTLKCLGIGRGIFWRTTEKNFIQRHYTSIEQINLETKEIKGSEIITQFENYYFDVSNVSLSDTTLPKKVVFIDDTNKLSLPYEISWLHYTGLVDYEPQNPGSGRSLSYNALGIKATIYIYDNLIPNIPKDKDSLVVKNEFKLTVNAFISALPNSEIIVNLSKSEHFDLQVFKTDEGFSVVGLGVFRGKFIKLRITHNEEYLLAELSNQFIIALDTLINSCSQIH